MRRFPIVKLPVIAVSTRAVRTFMRDLAVNGVGETSVSKYLSTLSAVFKWSRQKLDHPIPNPVLELPAKERRTVGVARTRRFLADEEFYLREAIAGLASGGGGGGGGGQMLPLFDLALVTGARQGELLSLMWADVATDRLLATVRDTKNSDDRQLLLSPDAIEVLERLRASPVRSLDGRVLNLQRGNVAKLFGRAKKLAKGAYLAECASRGAKPVRNFMDDLRWHDLRREAISTAAETCFVGQLDLQRFSGHREARSLRPYLAMQNDTALARTMPSRAVPGRSSA
jgi:integrase